MEIYWDPDFDEPLHKLGEYWHGWEINFYPDGAGAVEEGQPAVVIEPFRRGQSTFFFYHNRAFCLWGPPNSLADASKLKEWLEEREETLEEIVEGFDTRWDGNNTVGALTEHAQELLDELRMTMEDAFQHTDALPQYWKASDWFMNGDPDPEDRDVDALVQEAKSLGTYLDPDDVREYLNDLAQEEALDAFENRMDPDDDEEDEHPQPTLH